MKLSEKYKKEVMPALKEKLGKNVMALPRLEKIIINVGVGKEYRDSKFVDTVEDNLKRISGQQPVRTKAKKSISNFKLRQGAIIGIKVTLRNQRMFDFLEKLITITLPRVRDFSGIAKSSFDKNGNITIGFKDQIPFPEIIAEATEKLHGIEVTIVTSSKDDNDAAELLSLLGFPFKKN